MKTKTEIPAFFGAIAVVWVLICLSGIGVIVWAAAHFIGKYW